MASRREQNMQKEFVRMARLLSPSMSRRLFHIPNGGARASKERWDARKQKMVRYSVEGAILKAMGVVAGVADIAVMLGGGRVGFMEAKDPVNGELSTEQENFRDLCLELGNPWAEFRSVDEGLKILQSWGVTLRGYVM